MLPITLALSIFLVISVKQNIKMWRIIPTIMESIPFCCPFRLTFMLTCVCVISALSCAATLVIAGGVGQACHPSGDLSRVLRMVVDDNRTWRGVHLLGQAVLDNASYPLTFESLLSGCQRNLSVYQALQLDQVFNLDSYFTPPGSDIVSICGGLGLLLFSYCTCR